MKSISVTTEISAPDRDRVGEPDGSEPVRSVEPVHHLVHRRAGRWVPGRGPDRTSGRAADDLPSHLTEVTPGRRLEWLGRFLVPGLVDGRHCSSSRPWTRVGPG